MTLSLRRPLVAVFAFLMLLVMVGFAQPAQAACAQDSTKTTSSSKSTLAGVNTYWTSSNYTGGSPCSDINVINQNRSTSVIGAYKSSSGIWHIGDPEWVFDPQYQLVEVVLDITPSGVEFRTGSAVGSTVQRQLS